MDYEGPPRRDYYELIIIPMKSLVPKHFIGIPKDFLGMTKAFLSIKSNILGIY